LLKQCHKPPIFFGLYHHGKIGDGLHKVYTQRLSSAFASSASELFGKCTKVGATKGVCPKQQMVISVTTLPILELNIGLTNVNDGLNMMFHDLTCKN